MRSEARTLITGAGGYVGSRLWRHLLEMGHRSLKLATSKPIASPPSAVDAVDIVSLGNFQERSLLEAVCDGVTSIVHLAAPNEVESKRDPQRAIEVTVGGTLNLLEAAQRAGVRRFVYVSTAHVYGAPLRGHLTESCPTRPVHPYAITHRAAEDFVLAASTHRAIEGVVLRLSNAVGAPATADVQRWTLVANDLCRQAVSTKRIVLQSAGLQRRDFVPMADVCRAIQHFVELPSAELRDGLFNVGSGESIRVIDLAERIRHLAVLFLGVPVDIAAPPPAMGEREDELEFEIEKLRSTGFEFAGDLDQELLETLALVRGEVAHTTAQSA